MSDADPPPSPCTAETCYLEAAAAYVRGRAPEIVPATWRRGPLAELPPEALGAIAEAGRAAGLRLHPFKRSGLLPRVRRVLGALRGMAPASLLDVGSGRGAFLWPLLEALPEARVTSIDILPHRAALAHAVGLGGLSRLAAARVDVGRLAFRARAFDVVTLLEVLEHLREPRRALAEVLAAARRFVILSVPSRPDDNPEHLRLFDAPRLEALCAEAGAAEVRFDFVQNHIVAFARCCAP